MAYKSHPWYCKACGKWFKGGLGKAPHYRGKKHKDNIKKLRKEVDNDTTRGY